jgi:hypothetical protein
LPVPSGWLPLGTLTRWLLDNHLVDEITLTRRDQLG